MRKEKKKEERILAKQSGYCVMMTSVTSTGRGRGWGSGEDYWAGGIRITRHYDIQRRIIV